MILVTIARIDGCLSTQNLPGELQIGWHVQSDKFSCPCIHFIQCIDKTHNAWMGMLGKGQGDTYPACFVLGLSYRVSQGYFVYLCDRPSFSDMPLILDWSYHRQTAHVNMKTKISLQCPSLLVFYSFLNILYRERSEMGGPDGDEVFACGHMSRIRFITVYLELFVAIMFNFAELIYFLD